MIFGILQAVSNPLYSPCLLRQGTIIMCWWLPLPLRISLAGWALPPLLLLWRAFVTRGSLPHNMRFEQSHGHSAGDCRFAHRVSGRMVLMGSFFFIFCTLAAIPGLVFLFRYNTWQYGSSSHMKATFTQENDKLSNESQPTIHSKEI